MVNFEINDGIARVTLDAPPLNILTRTLLADARRVIRSVAQDETVRVLLLQTVGKHFSAGASVPEHMPPQCDEMIVEFMATVLALKEFPLPTIAAVQGRCLGGAFELVQAADIIVAGESAQFGQPEIQLGVFAPAACALLPERIGVTRAAELLFTGDAIPAREAQAAGLVTRVVADECIGDSADALARRIARHSAAVLRSMKKALRQYHQDHFRNAMAGAARIYTNELMRTHDALEGLEAFTAKRAPEWRNQ